MGCTRSKDLAYGPDTLALSTDRQQLQQSKKRATLQLNIQSENDGSETQGSTIDGAQHLAVVPKGGRTPEMTPRTALSSNASSEDIRPPRLPSVSHDMRMGKRLPSRAARAHIYKSPGTTRGSTAELSESEGEGRERFLSECMSESDSENRDESEKRCGGAAGPLVERRAKASNSTTSLNTRPVSCSMVGTAVNFARQNGKENNDGSRLFGLQQQPRPSAEIPPGPPELHKFLDERRPAAAAASPPFTVASTSAPKARNGENYDEKTHVCRVDFPNGMTYEGQLGERDGTPTGWGTVVLPDGVVYEGDWLDGRIHGGGALRLPNGNVYWGSWAEGRKHGSGTFVWADGSRYDGSFRAGKRSGIGVLRYATGATFTGQFECDVRHGSGCLVLPGGSSYDGEWAGDTPHGHGVYVEAGGLGRGGGGGERFEGSWKRGVRSGGGTLVQGYECADQAHDAEVERKRVQSGDGGGHSAWYSGNFDTGLPHGDGVMGYGPATFCGHVEHGVWTGGGGRVDLGDGAGTFEGTWSDGLPRGRGRWCGTSGKPGVDCSFKEGYSKLTWPG